MAIIESLGTAQLARSEMAELERTLEQRASEMVARWQDYTRNIEPGFMAYFMLEDQNHESIRQIFLESVGGSLEIPYPDEQVVCQTGFSILRAYSHAYDDDKPYDVTYVGARFEPVQ